MMTRRYEEEEEEDEIDDEYDSTVWWVSLRANHDHEDHPNASGN